MPEKAKLFWEQRKERGPRVSKYEEEIRRLAAEGLSGYQIARQLQIWPSQVYMIAKRKGITLAPARKGAPVKR